VITLLQMIFNFKCCSFEFSIHRRILTKCHRNNVKQHKIVFNIENNEKLNHIRKISEGSCDTIQLKITGIN